MMTTVQHSNSTQHHPVPLRLPREIFRLGLLLWLCMSLNPAHGQNGFCGSASGGPTNNPIAQHYGTSAYPWTDSIRWACVYNINDFSGSNMVAQFHAARDAAAAAGGGVVYFPSGTYTFTDDIYLTNGVVIRGDPPAVNDAKSTSFNPPTKLVFPQYIPTLSGTGTPNSTAFKTIRTAAGDTDSNIGLVHVDVNRAGINLQGDKDNGRNRNIVVFGVRNNNVAAPAPDVPASFQPAWSRYSYRFAANIRIQAYANVLVANNRLNDAITDNYDQPGYVVTNTVDKRLEVFTDGSRVPFHYGNHYGIVVNRNQSGGYNETPLSGPSLFRPGIVVRDNWVYHTMRVAIHVAGLGLVVRDNVIRDQSDKVWWTDPTGTKLASNSQTLENRGIDWAGWDVTVTGNDYEVYRHLLKSGPYRSVDGEGILIQECCGGTQVNGVTIAGNAGNAYIGLYKMPDMHRAIISNNSVGADIFVQADPNSGPSVMFDIAVVNNYNVSGGIRAVASAGGANNRVQNNTGSGTITYSCHVNVSGNSGFSLSNCLPAATANFRPSVTLTSPAAGATFFAPATINLDAVATDPDGTIAQVDFYRDTNYLGSDTVPPYSIIISNLAAGDYFFTARAWDNASATMIATPVYVRVLPDPRPVSAQITASGGVVRVTWPDLGPAYRYTVEVCSNLTAGTWEPAPPTNQWPVTLPGWTDPAAGAVERRFYRVRATVAP